MKFTQKEKDIIFTKTVEVCKAILNEMRYSDYEVGVSLDSIHIECTSSKAIISLDENKYAYSDNVTTYMISDETYNMFYQLLMVIGQSNGLDIITNKIREELANREKVHKKLEEIASMKIYEEESKIEEEQYYEKESNVVENNTSNEEVEEVEEEVDLATKVFNRIVEDKIFSTDMSTQVNPNMNGMINIREEDNSIIIMEKTNSFSDRSKNHTHEVIYNFDNNNVTYKLDGFVGDMGEMYQGTNASQRYKQVVSDLVDLIMKDYFSEKATLIKPDGDINIKFRAFKNYHYE